MRLRGLLIEKVSRALVTRHSARRLAQTQYTDRHVEPCPYRQALRGGPFNFQPGFGYRLPHLTKHPTSNKL